MKKHFSFAHWLLAIFGFGLVTASCTSILGIDTEVETNICTNNKDLPPLNCGFGSCQQLIPACTVNGLPVLECPAVTKTNDTDTCGDGIDNDCDGLVDENDIDTCTCMANELKGCYTGAPGTRGKGLCRDGFQNCDQGSWGKCDGDVTPEQEIADGRDNDCNGSIDEGLPCSDGEELECYGGSTDTLGKGPCKGGKQICKNGIWGECVGQQLPAALDPCNGFDDDCDGEVDNIGIPGSICQCVAGDTKSCYVNESGEKVECPLDLQGECQCGQMTCGSNQQFGPCIGAIKPTTDICDSKDNDCNGIIDNIGLPNTPCECGPGETQACYTGPMGTEGVGPCKPGERACVNGKFGICVGETVPKGTDACDGQVDDDCNGVIDNVGIPGSPCLCMNNTSEICFTGPPEKLNVGACKAGQRTCTNGNYGICMGQTLPGVELCDGLDNDCNGGVDDGIPGVGDSCFLSEYAGTPCYQGKIECPLGGAGTPKCVPSTKPGFIPEKCDGVDNDCNLIVDDGFFCCPNDGKVSGNETDLDCGGSCAQKCADGKGCIVGIDCISGNCFQNQCKQAGCMDGLKNGAESDTDCGEVCPMQCIVGKSCFVDNDCISRLCQPASKTCIQKPKGSACLADAECSTGNCVDGVCCSSSCSGECQACTAAKKGSGMDGDCGAIAGNTDPDSECQVTAPDTCGNTGACSGSSSCAKYSLGTLCAPASCTNFTTENPADTCDGQGVCVQKFDMPCQTGYGCVAGSCKTTCVSSGECDNGYFCNAPTCQIKKTNGDSCANGTQCQSANCIDGVCCDTICTDSCKACNIAGSVGTCSPIAANSDPINECNPGSCDGLGQCQKSNGSSCMSTDQCVSGNCIDGVCCNTPCLGTCVSCTNAGSVGSCSNVPANADPSNECNPGQCDGLGNCQGVVSATCAVPADCASNFCVDGYCCDTACMGTCEACSGTIKGQGANGTCGPILVNLDPSNECNPGSCNGVGSCQLPNGNSCMMGTQCASGNCVDGVCCNQACVGTCQACNVQNNVGTCVSIPSNTDPANECNPGACDGLGQCQIALGSSCTSAAQCTSGFCTDGVCCDNICSGLCQACTTALKGGGLSGQCGAVIAGQDPQNECDQEPASTCGKTGSCNGAGACANYTMGTVCQGASCVGNTLVNVDTCNGAGVCIDGGNTSCGAFLCNAGQCPPNCANDAQCAGGNYCDLITNLCTVKLSMGASCGGNNQCALGFCVDGVCCDSGCTGECKSCAVAGSVGTCTNVPAQQTDNSPACLGLQVCNGSGKCVDTNGQPCTANNECFSQACIDLVCCENACLGTCKACSNTKTGQINGACAPIASNSDPDSECVGATVCDGVGGCTKLPNGVACSGSTECTSNFCVDGVCCENSCPGACKACNAAKTGAADGMCSNVVSDTDPDNECTTECNGVGACEAANGSACMTGSQCQSGNCVDGICCNTACNGPCQSCNKVAGVCSPDFAGQQDLCSMGSICDAAGTCKKLTGDTCTLATECLSGFCADGICCSVACTGSCQACSAAKTGGVNGTCSFIASNVDPDNECAGGECNGAGACEASNGAMCAMATQCISNSCVDSFCCDSTCSGTCQACSAAKTGGTNGTCGSVTANTDPDNECPANECNGSGACELAIGTMCTVDAQCGSGFCVDGVCCSSACTSSCQACSAAKTGGTDGTCSFIASNADPDNECAGAECNGAGACEAVDGTSCAMASECLSNNCIDSFCCDTVCSGTCQACSAAKTGGTNGTCGSVSGNTDPDNECVGNECNGSGACELAVGAMCTVDAQCGSGFCVDGVCCSAACTGTCLACSAAKTGGADGTCLPNLVNTDPEAECTGVADCNGAGACEATNGAGCAMAADCVSNNCVDSFCCDTACIGSCQACSAAKTGGTNGTCGSVTANTDPDNECAGNDCNGAGVCELPVGSVCTLDTECDSSFCVDGFCCSASCTGTCVACSAALTGGVDGTCSPILVDTDPGAECTGTADCNGAGACELVNGIGPCTQNAQCVSGSCAIDDSVCCDSGCSGTCTACDIAKTGVASGTCSNVTTNTDPDMECTTECSGMGVCEAINGSACPNGNADCQSGYCAAGFCQTPTCTDNVKNGTESDIDCGGVSNGVTCPACTLLMFGGDTGRFMTASLPVDDMSPAWTATFAAGTRTDVPVALTMPNTSYGVAIIKDTQASNKLRYTKWTAGVWGSVTDVAVTVPFGALALGSSEGQALAAYREASTKKLFYSRFDGTTWSIVDDLAYTLTTTNMAVTLVPNIAGLTGGEAWMTYNEVNGANHELNIRTRISGTWGSPTVLSLTAAPTVAPEVVSLTNGELMVAYMTTGSVQVRTRRRNTAGTWLAETILPGGTAANMSAAANIALAPLPNGGAIVAFRNAANNRPMYSIWNGSVWSNPAEANSDSVAASISVARGMGGFVAELVYVDSGTTNAKHTRYNGSIWSTPVTLGAVNDNLASVSVAAPPP